MNLKQVLVIFAISMSFLSCALNSGEIKVKKHPEYFGIDPKLLRFYNEYMELAHLEGIKFTNNVTMGIKFIKGSLIKQKKTIGLCHTRDDFREIDIDEDFFARSTETSKTAVIFHELTHCMCDRDHDYGEGKFYPEDIVGQAKEQLHIFLNQIDLDNILKITPSPIPGHLEDGCPLSIMKPTILDDYCMLKHYQYYTHEMFDRCKRW